MIESIAVAKAWLLIAMLVTPQGVVTTSVEASYGEDRAGMRDCWATAGQLNSNGDVLQATQWTCVYLNTKVLLTS